jgi:uncharacterized membrane protein SpoIIM required for sporulation
MDIDQFIKERSPGWKRLEELLTAFERSPAWSVGHERIKELVTLYRQACSDLNQARSYTANPALLDSLNQLTGRAYRFVYSQGGKTTLRESFWNFVSVSIPSTFQKEAAYVFAALLPFVLGALFGVVAVKINPAFAEALIPDQFFTSSPKERVQEIEQADGERIDSAQKALAFGSFLYTHNIQVSFLAFSAGALTLVGGIFLLFYNGALLGAVAYMYHADGVATFFYAWVGPHGALELPAIVFAGAAGLRAGKAILMPGRLTRQAAIREAFVPVWRMLCASAMILVIAGLIEGSFSQFSARTVSYEVKIGIAVCLFVSLMAWLFFLKRENLIAD